MEVKFGMERSEAMKGVRHSKDAVGSVDCGPFSWRRINKDKLHGEN